MAKDYVQVYRSLLKRLPFTERAAVISRLDPGREKRHETDGLLSRAYS
jgi:hypothetical protein